MHSEGTLQRKFYGARRIYMGVKTLRTEWERRADRPLNEAEEWACGQGLRPPGSREDAGMMFADWVESVLVGASARRAT